MYFHDFTNLRHGINCMFIIQHMKLYLCIFMILSRRDRTKTFCVYSYSLLLTQKHKKIVFRTWSNKSFKAQRAFCTLFCTCFKNTYSICLHKVSVYLNIKCVFLNLRLIFAVETSLYCFWLEVTKCWCCKRLYFLFCSGRKGSDTYRLLCERSRSKDDSDY